MNAIKIAILTILLASFAFAQGTQVQLGIKRQKVDTLNYNYAVPVGSIRDSIARAQRGLDSVRSLNFTIKGVKDFKDTTLAKRITLDTNGTFNPMIRFLSPNGRVKVPWAIQSNTFFAKQIPGSGGDYERTDNQLILSYNMYHPNNGTGIKKLFPSEPMYSLALEPRYILFEDADTSHRGVAELNWDLDFGKTSASFVDSTYRRPWFVTYDMDYRYTNFQLGDPKDSTNNTDATKSHANFNNVLLWIKNRRSELRNEGITQSEGTVTIGGYQGPYRDQLVGVRTAGNPNVSNNALQIYSKDYTTDIGTRSPEISLQNLANGNGVYSQISSYDSAGTQSAYITFIAKSYSPKNAEMRFGGASQGQGHPNWITIDGGGTFPTPDYPSARVSINTTTKDSTLKVFGSFRVDGNSLFQDQVSIPNIPVYADNSAAIAGGLTVGRLYRTSTGILMVVY